jgi:hypothetical protein
MNSRYELSDPFHATPTMRICPLNFLLTSSTEGASLLQVPQPGAQNQKTTGLSARASVREKLDCVPMMFAATSLSVVILVIDDVVVRTSCEESSDPQPTRSNRLIPTVSDDKRRTSQPYRSNKMMLNQAKKPLRASAIF